MNFEDEDYVRLYTRDTPTWLSLGWEGQALLALTMRKVGRRNGVLDCDGFEPLEALVSVTGLPLEVVTAGFERLSKRGVMLVDGQRIVLPKFVKAQWARQGVAARKRASRDAQAADEVIAELIVPQNHSTVTLGHTESQPVTLGHSPIPSNPTNPIPPIGSDVRPRSAPPPANTARSRSKRIPEKPELLSEMWVPPDEAAVAAKMKFECTDDDIARMLPEFRYHWISGQGAGKRRGPKGWVRTWMNRMAYLAQNGQLYVSRANSNGAAAARELRPFEQAANERILKDVFRGR